MPRKIATTIAVTLPPGGSITVPHGLDLTPDHVLPNPTTPCSQGSGAVLARWVFRLTDGTCVVGASTDLAISDYNLVPMP